MEDKLEERKKKVFEFLKFKWNWLVYLALALIAWFGYFIRTRNLPLLIDATTGKYIPADLDAHAFLRYAKTIVETGSLPSVDYMRYFPWGYSNMIEFKLLSYSVAYLYKIWYFFNDKITLEYVFDLYPPIAFVIGLVFFFLFVRRVFNYKVALVASLLLAIVPIYLHRTIAGFGDKEAMGMMLMFIAFYFFIVALQSKKIWKNVLFGSFSGIFTGLMSLVWGGVETILLTIGIFYAILIIFNKFNKGYFYTHLSWYILTVTFLMYFRGVTFWTTISSFNLGINTLAIIATLVYLILFRYDLLKIRAKIKDKLPSGIFSFFIVFIVTIILTSIKFGPRFINNKINEITTSFINPWGTGRWALTVAESHQPYFVDFIGQVGWFYTILILIGAITLFHSFIKRIVKKAWIPTLFYSLLIFGIMFNRYASGSRLNGETSLAKFLYFGSIAIFILFFVGYYLYSFYRDKKLFSKIKKNLDVNYVFIFALSFILTVAARSAVRLIFVYSFITAIFAGYLIVYLFDSIPRLKDASIVKRIVLISLMIFLLFISRFGNRFIIYALLSLTIGSIFVLIVKNIKVEWKNVLYFILYLVVGVTFISLVFTFSNSTLAQAKSVGSIYTSQWQVAGKWIRENTPKDAVFAHWWDYGYLVQTGGERATITDGGNARQSLNHFMGRYVLTGQNEREALEFLKAHNATNLLIISDEIGKYPAFSSIGADVNWDRYSWLQPFALDLSKTQETRNESVYLYTGVSPLDEDFNYQGQFYPRSASGIIGIFLPLETVEGGVRIKQPTAVLGSPNGQVRVPVECIFFNGKEILFNEAGLKGCLQILPVIQNNQRNNIGSAIYISEKVRRTNFVQLYLFGKESKNFKLVYSDEASIPLAVYNGRIFGPLKIWEISYPEDLEVPDMFFIEALPDPRVEDISGRP